MVLTMFRTSIIAVRLQNRHLSLLDNVKKILSRSKPSEAQSTSATTTTLDSSVLPEDPGSFITVGQRRNLKPKIVGHDFQFPERKSGPELFAALSQTFDSLLGSNVSSLDDEQKLALARQITLNTGRRIPDVILNAAKTKEDLVKFLEKEEKYNEVAALVLDEQTLPGNVTVLQSR